jgi:hypothetical protein
MFRRGLEWADDDDTTRFVSMDKCEEIIYV